MSTKTILQHFLGLICPACRKRKQENTAFCRSCYFKLPERVQHNLWRRFGEGFEQAFAEGLELLSKQGELELTGQS